MDYYQGYEDAIRQTRISRTSGILGFFLRILLSIFYGVFVYMPLLILGYFIAEKISTLYSDDIFIKCGLTLMISYMLFAVIYFLKGLMIGLKLRGSNAWFLIWIACVVSACGVQTILTFSLLEKFFYNRSITNYQVWSLLGATAVAITIYSHYRFLGNVAPASVFWGYKFGFTTASFINRKELNNSRPNKSGKYFENTPMKVSFKKMT